MSILPAELIEDILEHVYGEYRSPEAPSDLYRCALVSHTWRAISQSLIFSELLLCAAHEERVKTLLVAQSCHFRQYVRKAWIKDDGGSDSIKEFLNWLPNIQGLYVLCCGPISKSFEHPSSEAISILRNLTSLGLSTLTSFPVELFYHCCSLRELKINGSTFDVDTADQERFSTHSSISSLHSLHVAGVLSDMRILEWMLTPQCPFELTALKTLRVSDRSDELQPYEWIQKIVRSCGPTLRDLMIDPPTSLVLQDPELTPESLLYPSTLSNLRVITISIWQEINNYTNYVPWMNAFVSSLPVPNRLEEIRIPTVFMFSRPDGNDAQIEADMSVYGWEALDTVLTLDHVKLKKVVFGVYGLDRPRGQILRSLLREKLPQLDGSGILEIVGSRAYGWMSTEECWWRVK
ncbi:hypothetical protein BDN72DRAFT_846815 [Pluteus cervinus]|uniref:Uncharacterized protein n=1 Tax=Pluteus cervinus TaxID=181527 RepID=A0ACD3AEW6_9AGAR|nr:hypothetical protein BDN72DRAFT_846815 [Pluteus cervinus]